MTTTEIIPQIPAEGIQKATQELGDVRLMLTDYELEAKRIKVETPEQYAEAGELLKRVRDAKKKASWVMSPLKSITKTIAEKFRTMEQAELNMGERIEGILEPKMVDFKRREREAAFAEERRLNAERRKEAERIAEEQRRAREKEIEAQRKAGEIGKREAAKQVKQAAADAEVVKNTVQEVKVEAATPKVAGLRQRIQWRFKVVDEAKIPRAFMQVNETAIGQFVRNAKDKALAEKTIPGIEVWWEDCV